MQVVAMQSVTMSWQCFYYPFNIQIKFKFGIKMSDIKIDEKGNRVVSSSAYPKLNIVFAGENNLLILNGDFSNKKITIQFPSNNGVCIIGDKGNYSGRIRVGYNCLVLIGNGVTCTSPCEIFTAEGSKVVIGDDCMIASGNEIRAEDSHAIYSVETGERLNKSKDILIGEHVWIANHACVLSGTVINYGCTVAHSAVVKGKFKNNCILSGIPAKCAKRDAIWERVNIAFSEPWVRENVHSQNLYHTKHLYNKTDDSIEKVVVGKGVQDLCKKYAEVLGRFNLQQVLDMD